MISVVSLCAWALLSCVLEQRFDSYSVNVDHFTSRACFGIEIDHFLFPRLY